MARPVGAVRPELDVRRPRLVLMDELLQHLLVPDVRPGISQHAHGDRRALTGTSSVFLKRVLRELLRSQK